MNLGPPPHPSPPPTLNLTQLWLCLWALYTCSLVLWFLFRSYKSFAFYTCSLSCLHSLHILDINLLSDVSLENMLSHTVGSLYILLMVYFAVQKLFKLMLSHFFFFIPIAVADIYAKILL